MLWTLQIWYENSGSHMETQIPALTRIITRLQMKQESENPFSKFYFIFILECLKRKSFKPNNFPQRPIFQILTDLPSIFLTRAPGTTFSLPINAKNAKIKLTANWRLKVNLFLLVFRITEWNNFFFFWFTFCIWRCIQLHAKRGMHNVLWCKKCQPFYK